MDNGANICFSDWEKGILASLIGRRIDGLEYVPSLSGRSDTAFEFVELRVEGEAYTLSGSLRPIYYFGGSEDISVLSFCKGAPRDLATWYGRQRHLHRELSMQVDDIIVYEDHIYRVLGREPFHYVYTRALTFRCRGERLVFERGGDFSEDIIIRIGARAERNIPPVEKEILDGGDIVLSVNGEPYTGPLDKVLEGDEEPDHYRVERRITSLREWAERH